MPRDNNLHPSLSSSSRPSLSIRRSLKAEESHNMLEVMHGNAGMQRPPEAQTSRVRNLGRTIKERGELCQWIHSMTKEPASPRVRSPVDVTYNATVTSPAPPTSPEIAAVLSDLPAAGNDDRGVVAKPSSLSEQLGTDPVKEESGSGKEHTQDENYQQQLDAIRQQQRHLVEQERALKEKLTLTQDQKRVETAPERVCAQLQDNDSVPSPAKVDKAQQETKRTEPNPVVNMDVRRRRLKGSLANCYARRDEGTIGSLLWTCEGGEGSPAASSVNCTSASRIANMKQENSSNISQLMSQTSFLRGSGPPKSNKNGVKWQENSGTIPPCPTSIEQTGDSLSEAAYQDDYDYFAATTCEMSEY